MQVEPSLANGQGFNASAQPANLFVSKPFERLTLCFVQDLDEQAKYRASQAASSIQKP